jgi:hypothetical protein
MSAKIQELIKPTLLLYCNILWTAKIPDLAIIEAFPSPFSVHAPYLMTLMGTIAKLPWTRNYQIRSSNQKGISSPFANENPVINKVKVNSYCTTGHGTDILEEIEACTLPCIRISPPRPRRRNRRRRWFPSPHQLAPQPGPQKFR